MSSKREGRKRNGADEDSRIAGNVRSDVVVALVKVICCLPVADDKDGNTGRFTSGSSAAEMISHIKFVERL